MPYSHDIRSAESQSFSARPKDFVDHELAGRRDPSHTFKDLRSARKARRRARADLKKYFSYKGVNRGQLDQEHYVPHHYPGWGRHGYVDLLDDQSETAPMTKQMLYREAQEHPRPPQIRRSRAQRAPDYSITCKAERQQEERRHLQTWATDDALDIDCEDQYLIHGLPRTACFTGCRFMGGYHCLKPWQVAYEQGSDPYYSYMIPYSEFTDGTDPNYDFLVDAWDIRRQMCVSCGHFPERACKGHDESNEEYCALYDAIAEYLVEEYDGITGIYVRDGTTQTQRRHQEGRKRPRWRSSKQSVDDQSYVSEGDYWDMVSIWSASSYSEDWSELVSIFGEGKSDLLSCDEVIDLTDSETLSDFELVDDT